MLRRISPRVGKFRGAYPLGENDKKYTIPMLRFMVFLFLT